MFITILIIISLWKMWLNSLRSVFCSQVQLIRMFVSASVVVLFFFSLVWSSQWVKEKASSDRALLKAAIRTTKWLLPPWFALNWYMLIPLTMQRRVLTSSLNVLPIASHQKPLHVCVQKRKHFSCWRQTSNFSFRLKDLIHVSSSRLCSSVLNAVKSWTECLQRPGYSL